MTEESGGEPVQPSMDATIDAAETLLRDAATDRGTDVFVDARETSVSDGGLDAGPDVPFVEEGCEDAGGIVANFRCGLFDQTGCSNGEGCYPYSLSNGRCGAMEHGSFCREAGTKGQGETCRSRLECAAGFTCVITGSGQGTICVKLCDIYSTIAQCPEGQTCFGLSVQTVGTCH